MIGRKVKFDIIEPNGKMLHSIKNIEKDVKGEIVAVAYSDEYLSFFFLICVIDSKKGSYFVTRDSRDCTLIG